MTPLKPALAAAALLLTAAPALAHDDASHPAAAAAGTVEGTGQVKTVDAKAGAVTIHHGPIAALGWPAMTMTFKATPAALQAAKPGQTVRFTLQTADNQVIAIRPQ
jgi:Cu(I)/Ag(I) efflux system protein CusF